MVEHIKADIRASISERSEILSRARNEMAVRGGIIIETCNRVEFFTGCGLVNDDTVRHLFRMVSGLESAITGDSAIQGQVKRAYQEAAAQHNLSASLHKLFQTALAVGKKVRTETGIGKGAVSYSQAAANLVALHYPDYRDCTFTFVGVNKMNRDIIRFLQRKGGRSFFIANRGYDAAASLAEAVGGTAFRFDGLSQCIAQSDVVIASTAAPHAVIKTEAVQPKKPLLLIDLAVPNDIAPEVAQNPLVTLYNVRDIEQSVQARLTDRTAETIQAEKIIDLAIADFNQWQQKTSQHHNFNKSYR